MIAKLKNLRAACLAFWDAVEDLDPATLTGLGYLPKEVRHLRAAMMRKIDTMLDDAKAQRRENLKQQALEASQSTLSTWLEENSATLPENVVEAVKIALGQAVPVIEEDAK